MGIETASDTLIRKVQFAVELIDPFTGAAVSKDIKVEARADDGRPTGPPPIVNRSGKFVWLDTADPAPTRVAYETDRLPYASGEIDLSAGLPADKLVKVTLKPTSAYSVPSGVTAVRGSLFRSEGLAKRPIPNAILQLVWAIEQPPGWIPPAPPTVSHMRPGEAISDPGGQFIVFSRLPKSRTQFSIYVGYPPQGDPAFNATLVTSHLTGKLPRARLQVTRLDIGMTRSTPADFKFLDTVLPGHIPEGRLLARDVQLDWNELN